MNIYEESGSGAGARPLDLRVKISAATQSGRTGSFFLYMNVVFETIIKDSNMVDIKAQCLSMLNTVCFSMNHLFQIQAQIQISGNSNHTFLASELIRFCALSQSGSLSHARTILSDTPNPTTASFNHVIRGCAVRGSPTQALHVFLQMRRSEKATPNLLTFPFILKACASLSDLRKGGLIHADIVKTGTHTDVYIQNALISFYGACRKVVHARRVFDEMSIRRNQVSWNAMLSAYVHCSWVRESIQLFSTMRYSDDIQSDETTMVILLSAAAETGNFNLGRWLHSQIVTKGLSLNLQLGSSLVNMYAKCGAIGNARVLFRIMHAEKKNVWTWSAMILGLAQHGLADEALQLFAQMTSYSVKPNYVTYLGVLCACSHSGMVEEGYRYFNEMIHTHGIHPRMSHYSAMVDILGRNGRLEEALWFIEKMKVDPDPVVWRTLLSCCNIQRMSAGDEDVGGIGDRVRSRLLELEPRRCGNYVMVANMCAEVSSWDEAAKVRRVMREQGLKKRAGESCIEIGGVIRRFLSGEDGEDGDVVLKELNLKIKKIDCVDINTMNTIQLESQALCIK
ncbi:Pentatricopeptide repeat-containing protein [Zostera marina]|uniref:Pentatricopeptide repeat-containing protein n=1 Tax=Zostera marina TaxID=29655 RepID=A0A0K9PBY4_ZOSMR|nr:Pentatricopeptide repeat-containing protein [Zostera marina]